MKLTFHTDPGHGWLETTIAEVSRLGIGSRISSFSYIGRDSGHMTRVYLEEDCEAHLLINAMRERGEVVEPFTEINSNRDSFIRNLPSWRASKGERR